MKFELFCPVYNEEFILPYTIEFYQNKLGKDNVIFNFYDNSSTDRTVEIAKLLGCNVHVYETGGEIRDDLLLEFKNTVWKNSSSDFVIVIDCDEWLDIDPNKLVNKTILGSIGYNMVGDGTEAPNKLTHGVRHEPQDKVCVFSPIQITNINYTVGAHQCSPEGNVVWATSVNLYHMKLLSADYVVKKYAESKSRLSDINKKYKWGVHYTQSEESIRNMQAWAIKDRIKIREI